MFDPILLFPGLPGGPELLIVLFVLVLLFGANKIPRLARASGQAMGEFKRGRDDVEADLRESLADDAGPAARERATDRAE
jgi:sec-independent protein translocase protein TatA